LKRKPRNSKPTANAVRIDPADPDPAILRVASQTLKQKGVIVFPTTGLYGLGADALCAEAVQRVFAIKRRPARKPVLVLLSKLGDMDGLVQYVPDYARKLLGLWPGGITLIFMAGEKVPTSLTGGTGKIGVRLPAHPVARALAEHFGGPITGTSANLSGFPAAASTAELAPDLCRAVDLVLDAGPLAGGPGSTIVDATVWPVVILRQGAVPRQAIDRILNGL
jgi:L-threonylcarbamoyladenylate synthase